MKREELIQHIDGTCYLHKKNEEGEWWINCITGDICFIPYVDVLNLTSYCHIFYELKVDAPFQYESDYEVYKLWREQDIPAVINKKPE